jgi:hypothetical protein
MIIAQQKRKENLVEYLMYMWQVEDVIRACRLNMEEIERRVIAQYDQPDGVKREIRRWYRELTEQMRSEGVTEKGHIRLNRQVVDLLTGLHRRLLRSPQETVYGSLYYRALPAIVQLRARSGGEEWSEMETCLTAIYGYLMLKMQRKEISPETVEGVRQINGLLTFLAARFREEEEGICSN